jgi:hypothetical protein
MSYMADRHAATQKYKNRRHADGVFAKERCPACKWRLTPRVGGRSGKTIVVRSPKRYQIGAMGTTAAAIGTRRMTATKGRSSSTKLNGSEGTWIEQDEGLVKYEAPLLPRVSDLKGHPHEWCGPLSARAHAGPAGTCDCMGYPDNAIQNAQQYCQKKRWSRNEVCNSRLTSPVKFPGPP